MSEIRRFDVGSDDDDLTHDKIKSLPMADKIPAGSVKVSHDNDYYKEAHKHGYNVHFHNGSETAYLHNKAEAARMAGKGSHDPAYKDSHKNKGK